MAEYEFSAPQNAVVGRLASRATVWGIISAIGGALSIMAALLNVAVGVDSSRTLLFFFASLPQLSVGFSFIHAGAKLKATITTQGHDVTLLMEALRNLVAALRIQIGITILFIAMVAALAVGTTTLR